MLTLYCRRVNNMISCVKLLWIFRSNYIGLIHAMLFWSQKIHTDLSVRPTFLYYAAIHQYLCLFMTREWRCTEAGRIDMQHMSIALTGMFHNIHTNCKPLGHKCNQELQKCILIVYIFLNYFLAFIAFT